MAIRVSEDKGSFESATLAWDKITHSLELETKTLPEDDKRFFESAIKFLVGKDTKLSNIKPEYMYYFMMEKKRILTLFAYPMVITPEYRRRKLVDFLGDLSLLLSENALAWRYGPMGFQESHMRQTLTQPPLQEKR